MDESMANPGVALLFADADLSAHLREALVELGARIVYEGAAAQAQPEALLESGADVIVINLEPDEDEHFDRLHALLEQGSQRVVFNDAEVSRDLSGWDRARWARHLAAKLLGNADVDPPRPVDARSVEASPSHASDTPRQETRPKVSDDDPVAPAWQIVSASEDAALPGQEGRESEQLSAELEALLADGDGVIEADDADTASDPDTASAPSVQIQQRQTIATPAPATDWSLLDADAEPPASEVREDASEFGIEKIHAADYLKPDAGEHASPVEPGLKLELVSLEESVAPSMADRAISEMVLDTGDIRIRRMVLVGAGHDATLELGEFLAGLPETLPAMVLIVQHQRDQHARDLAAALDTATHLPVKVAGDGVMARHCEAWLVPAGYRCQVGRDGRMSLLSSDTNVQADPSIDQCLDALVDTFGDNMIAIVLAGDSHDALAGAQAVAARGGQVWTLDPVVGNGNGMSMATRIQEEGLAVFGGSPAELARHLVEEYA